MRARDMRFNRLYETLHDLCGRILYATQRRDDPAPECPVCRTQGKDGKMVRHTTRGVICDECGSRIW